MAELTHSDNHNSHTFEGLALKDVIPKNRKPLYKDWTLIKLNTLLLCALLTQIASGYDSSMLNGMQSLPQWKKYFGQPTGTRLGAMTFGPTGGILISVVVSSQLCEKFGRRYPICGGSLIIILGSILQTAAVNYGMFVVSRFFVGFGLGIVSVAAPPLLSEVAYPSHRGKIVSFYLVTWSLGSLIAAWITYGTFKMTNSSWSWRIPSVLQCSFSLIQAVLSLLAPESPRWLIYNGRKQEALDILTKYHGDGDPSSRLVRFEMAEITATLEMEKIQKLSRWSEWLSTKGNQHRLFLALYIPAMLQWSGNALTSYYLSKVLNSINVTDSKTQLIINACLSIWSFVSAAFFATLVDRAGRRRLFLCGMGGMGISYIIWTICSAINEEKGFKNSGFAAAVLLMIFVFGACYHMCSPVAPTYIMEVVPYSLRAKASMLYQLTGNLAGVYNSFANPVAMDAISWRYYIVWCVAIGVHFTLIYFFFPETKGKGLEEVAEIFDGPDALSGVNAMKETGLDMNADKVLAFGDEALDFPAKGSVAQVERV
ncbi:general substrate transporter [Talaromyces proteolyticus]|uniref:General substrate transporter n=1 Tax=Talaromyces proteolyticus TaxID=1131652 RepID=A0AAD4KM67_9EURO|nr:general substrate transporter [Talaromyces proteolyticus]KAH8692331.1 general substrate transporter [Talaromyces proteolyticus]